MPPAVRLLLLSACVAFFAAGCAKPPAAALPLLAADAPASRGVSPLPLSGQPTPLTEKAPFGLYADAPSADTLARLSIGTLSPEGRFRVALTAQGIWVARVDGAWVWELSLPAPPAADPQEGRPVPATPKPAVPVEPLQWTTRGDLFFPDQSGTWYLANPLATSVSPLPAALKGKEQLAFSPDSTQVLYRTPGKAGLQLWRAKADGSSAKLLGENLVAHWDESTGSLVVTPLNVSTGTKAGAGNARPLGSTLLQ